MNVTADSHAAVAFSLPEQYFPDGDDVCATAGTYVAKELEIHLEKHGHSIPEWVKGGCQEDAWVYLESRRDDVIYYYGIMFFPRSSDAQSMAVRYGIKVGFWRRIFGAESQLSANDPIHELLRSYAAKHEKVEILTAREFDSRY
jgi:hypothetical protein